jgi:hypothetical protein
VTDDSSDVVAISVAPQANEWGRSWQERWDGSYRSDWYGNSEDATESLTTDSGSGIRLAIPVLE